MQTLQDRNLINHFSVVRQQLADPGTMLTVLGKLEFRGRDRKSLLAGSHRRQALTLSDRLG
jgi:hypothetical protein